MTITTTISGGYVGQVEVLTIDRVDNNQAVVLSPALPQPFTTSDDLTFSFTFTDPNGDCIAGYDFTYQVQTFSPGDTFASLNTYAGSSGRIAAPIGTVIGETTIYDGINPAAGKTVNYRLVVPPPGSSGAFDGCTKTAMSSDIGLIEIELLQFAEYEFWYEHGCRQRLITTDQSPVTIPQLYGKQ